MTHPRPTDVGNTVATDAGALSISQASTQPQPISTIPDAEALYADLLQGVRAMWSDGMVLMGIASGGAWAAQRLQADMGLQGPPGILSSAMHRDDFAQRGMAVSTQTAIPFDVNGADIVLVDDVLFTGRTVRAVLNELFDFGRPARVRLVVLADRYRGRQLPVQADFAATRLVLPPNHLLSLAQTDSGRFEFQLREV